MFGSRPGRAADPRRFGRTLGAAVTGHSRRGHAIEARVYAEDPAKSFAPQPGHLARVVWPEAGADLRIETGIAEGLDVTPYYDPMIAKVVAFGETRKAAIARLDRALEETIVEIVGPAGPARNNVSFLRRLLQSDPFQTGAYDTSVAEAMAKQK